MNSQASTETPDDQRQDLNRSEEPARPSILPEAAAPGAKDLQRSLPTMWAMTLDQWNSIINVCKQSPLYEKIKQGKSHRERFVNLYDINESFVKPWTRDLGCGIALLMNPEGLQAEVMLSHAWGEDVEQCQQAMNTAAESAGILGSTPIWFCTFAQYQPEDGAGPSIKEQLLLDPFTAVIESQAVRDSGKMFAIHTSTADLYERLWCVREVHAAVTNDVQVLAALSDAYMNEYVELYTLAIKAGAGHELALEVAGLTVHSARAKCRIEDRGMLLKALLNADGGFDRVDQVVTEFRWSVVRPQVLHQLNQMAANTENEDIDWEGVWELVESSPAECCNVVAAMAARSHVPAMWLISEMAGGDGGHYDSEIQIWARGKLRKIATNGDVTLVDNLRMMEEVVRMG